MTALERARNVDIMYFLGKNGIKPSRETQARAYYLSPFREEHSPSFTVFKDENRFYDWGEKKGGDVINIAERLFECTTSKAIAKLLDDEDIPQIHKRDRIIERMPAIEVVHEKDGITNVALVEYMEKIRCIPISVLDLYCKEIQFSFENSRHVQHTGVGMKNDVGGWVIRGTWFKGSTSPAGVKTIKTTETDECYIFEGFLDFMSHVVLWGEPEHTTIILNSTVFVHIMLDILKGFDKVHVWVDNDNAGNIAVDEMMASGVNVVDRRDAFADYNDLNEKLQAEG